MSYDLVHRMLGGARREIHKQIQYQNRHNSRVWERQGDMERTWKALICATMDQGHSRKSMCHTCHRN